MQQKRQPAGCLVSRPDDWLVTDLLATTQQAGAQLDQIAHATCAALAAGPADRPALVVVLDHVTDAGNFGATVRSAEVVGAAGDLLAPYVDRIPPIGVVGARCARQARTCPVSRSAR